jgi:hypothetical protein
MNEQAHRHYVEERLKQQQKQIDLIIQVLDEQEKRGWMSLSTILSNDDIF